MKKTVLILMLVVWAELTATKFHSSHKGKHTVNQYKKYLIDMAKKDSGRKIIDNSKPDKLTRKKLKKKLAVIRQDENLDEEGNPLPLFTQEEIDEFERSYEQSFYFRKLQGKDGDSRYSRRQLDGGDTYLKEVTFVLNQYGMYYTELGDSTFKGLIDMIRFDELIDDKTANNLMIAKPTFQGTIDSIQMEQIQSRDGNLISLPCFQIRDPYYDDKTEKTSVWWQICEDFNAREGNPDLLASRIQIYQKHVEVKIVHIIEYRYHFKYKKETVVVNDNDIDQMDTDIFDGWTYPRQDEWGGSCRSGAQSPINIKDEDVLATTAAMQIITRYKGDPSTKAIRGTNDYFLVGQFGFVLYQNGISSKARGSSYYCAWRIEFKFGGEHQINGNGNGEQQMEILVYHKRVEDGKPLDISGFNSADRRKDLPGCEKIVQELIKPFEEQENMAKNNKLERDALRTNTDLITSFLVNIDPSNATPAGVFWKGLSQVNFREEQTEEEKKEGFKSFTNFDIIGGEAEAVMNKDYLADLEGLVDDGLSYAFRHSFYAYEGSLSQPNCQNRITRVVFSNPILVNAEYFQGLKGKVLDGFNAENRRKVQNTKGDRNYRIFRHIDTTFRNCSVTSILKSFQNPAFKKLTTTEKQDWKKLLEEVTKRISEYSSARSRYLSYTGEESSSESTLSTMDTRNTQFTHTATISTGFENVQRVSQQNAAKIFGVKELKNVKVGKSFKLGGNEMNDVKITLLGKNSKEYNDAAFPTEGVTVEMENTGQAKQDFEKGSDMITQQDKDYKEKKSFDKMINKVQAEKAQEELNKKNLDDRKLKKMKKIRKLRKMK